MPDLNGYAFVAEPDLHEHSGAETEVVTHSHAHDGTHVHTVPNDSGHEGDELREGQT